MNEDSVATVNETRKPEPIEMLRYTEMFFLVLFELYLMRAHLE
jgi:hypothetical protein